MTTARTSYQRTSKCSARRTTLTQEDANLTGTKAMVKQNRAWILLDMLCKDKKTKIEELCHPLNNMRRVGFSAYPMEMFFNRPVKGHLMNQFAGENEIWKSVEKQIINQFKHALKKGWYNRDNIVEGDLVGVRSPWSEWDIIGERVAQKNTTNGEGALY